MESIIRWEKGDSLQSPFFIRLLVAALGYRGFPAHLRREFEEREKKGKRD
jgi:hypothetical protein